TADPCPQTLPFQSEKDGGIPRADLSPATRLYAEVRADRHVDAGYRGLSGTGADVRSNGDRPHPGRYAADQLVGNRVCPRCNLLDRQPLAPQCNAISDTGFRMAAQVDCDHIHGNTADQTGSTAIDQHRRAAAGMTGIAITIANGAD